MYFGNSIDAYIPELWAQESIAILEENMVAANLIHRDFEPTIAKFGDIVNTRKPADFTAKRKGVTDNVTIQDASSTNVPVTLNQHVHTSFLLRDGEESKSFKDLVAEYLTPAVVAQARFLDRVVLGQYHRFMSYAYGSLQTAASTNILDRILGGRNKLNVNKAPMEDRFMIHTPNMETVALQLEMFLTAEKVGDNGTALREASLGRKLGLNHYMCQNMGSIANTNVDKVTGAINNASGEPKGDTTITVDGFSAAIGNNSWVSVDGDPHRVVSTVGGATPTSITLTSPGLRNNVADNAVVTVIDPGAVNYASGYASGYDGQILVDGFTNFPTNGQLVSFGTSSSSAIYSIVEASSSGGYIVLDRPLEAALSDNDAANVSPPGEYNFVGHRNSLALVVRPLAMPRVGALSSVVNHNGLSMRAVITYDGNKQGHLVTIDMLCGIALLDAYLGSVVLG